MITEKRPTVTPEPVAPPALTDGCGRVVDYLRVSITERCNLRCAYCMPPGVARLRPCGNTLSAVELARLVALFAELGVRRVRVTGGEPLVRGDVADIVARFAAIDGIEEVSLSTNGVLLEQWVPRLRDAGLKRVNVSLDSLRPERVAAIAGADALQRVLAGVAAADAAGLGPVKLNTVLLRGTNHDEVLDFARLTLEHPWHVRFIELMPVAWNSDIYDAAYFGANEALALLRAVFDLDVAAPTVGGGPASLYRIRGAAGLVGLITPMCNDFCDRCNRVRLSSSGRIRPCLFGADEVDLGHALREGASPAHLRAAIADSLRRKPEGHGLFERRDAHSLVSIGG